MRDIIIHGDVYGGLGIIDDESIAIAITSPPYWKQRDYRFEGQVGQESAPEEYIGRLVKIFERLRGKLRRDGVFFLNVGDKYLGRYGKSHLLQLPYRIAYHMVRNGWILEDILVWHKPNHMPSSVKDRFTNTYEPILVFSRSRDNIYSRKRPAVLEIPLQQTPWRHTAVYPERLVEELLNRVRLSDGDLILDPFAGTGTTAAVVKRLRESFYGKDIYSVMIEKGEEFVQIIKERTGIGNIISADEEEYHWSPVEEYDFPENIKPEPLLESKYGEVFIAPDYGRFISVLKGITTKEFKDFHREDAIFFFGLRKWNLESLYYAHTIYRYGYVLRNMIVVSSNEDYWYPVFMFARDTTRVSYRFYLDRVRVEHRLKERRRWQNINFLGMRVKDILEKTSEGGYIAEILERYDDGFPRIVLVNWRESSSVELVIHPEKEEFMREGIRFYCPNCRSVLDEPYDPIGENVCPVCGVKLWESIDTVPLVREPEETKNITSRIHDVEMGLLKTSDDGFRRTKDNNGQKTIKFTKFAHLERINWGASPGARKLMLGEYFTKMRLYRIEQPIVAQYLNLLRKARGLTIRDIVEKFPDSYKHTVGHWFRKDFGGSIPLPEDLRRLRKIFGIEDGLLRILERTALKFQTVKSSSKGKNPGDFLSHLKEKELVQYLKSLFLPSSNYLTMLEESSEILGTRSQG